MPPSQSQIALAQDTVDNKRVELVPYMPSFIFQSNNSKKYSVQLFPKENVIVLRQQHVGTSFLQN